MLVISSFIIGLFLTALAFLWKTEPKVLVGVYRLPGRFYWFKRLIFLLLLKLRSRKKQSSKQKNDSEIVGYGRGLAYESMEKPQLLTNNEYAIDSCYFAATNKDGVNFVCRIARRRSRVAEIWLFLELPNFGCLQFPRHPDTDVYYTNDRTYQAAGLSFEILEPMKKWKITYSGKLRKGLCNDVSKKPDQFVETNFSFIWNAFSQPFNTDTDLASSLICDSVAREEWNRDFFERLKQNHQSHYEQWGELRGRVSIEGQEETQLTLQSVRDHSIGNRDWRDFHRYIIHFIYLETGMTIQVGIFSQPNLMSHVKIGYVSYPNGDIVSASGVNLNIWEVGEDPKEPPENWSFSFVADGQTYKVHATRGTTPVWYHHNDRGGKVMEVFTTFEVNSFKGRGISEYFYRNYEGPYKEEPPPTYELIEEPSITKFKDTESLLSLPFTSEACQCSALVGGKGAQLAQLTSLQHKVSAKVPPGICLTLSSFELQVQVNASIDEALQQLTSTSVNQHGHLASACAETVKLINSVEVCPQVREAIRQSLIDHVDVDLEQVHFAVRSSAAGEDGDEASSAGQMETILGVVGLTQIMDAVRKCWSSAYAVQAVEYRRQHGQPISVPVGVVIQKMVPADAAGVLFTADPITQSNSHLVINANFGLGESVVSGKISPDTIYVERDPECLYDPERLKVGQVIVGNKTVKIVETGDGGVVEEYLGDESQECCLQDNMILQLAKLGIELEKYFGSSRDVEWAVVRNEIYMLQCRPITITDTETEEDLMHEFDCPKTCDFQWWTTCNISEMMPGAVTPLTVSIFKTTINQSMQEFTVLLGTRAAALGLPKAVLSYCNHLFISIMDIAIIMKTAMFARNDVMAINLLGQILPELEDDQIENHYGKRQCGHLRKLINFVKLIKASFQSLSMMKEFEEKMKFYEVGSQAKTAVELYHYIDKHLKIFEKAFFGSILVSTRSGNMTNALISIIAGDANSWTPEHYGDIAILLSNCTDVYSAEVPRAMESIAKEITEKGQEFVDQFLETSNKDCMGLFDTYTDLKDSVEVFLSRHGHRCLRESELRETSWRSSPEKFVSVLKVILKNKSYEKCLRSEVSVKELLKKMKTKIPFHKKWIIQRLLPIAWKSVGDREWAKSLAIKVNDILKSAYSRLADLLFQEGRLPDPDLVYFFTHQEIAKLLSTPSARLILKAQKRRNILKKQMEMKFERISKSQPVPIVQNTDLEAESNVEVLKGMPVSQGQVIATARVVHSIDQASVIKPGDILIVSSTDVGWSPYFPLISGLVTELGGLISHGAVVAREYGIPCIVNVPSATSVIKTGERLQLDGRKGIIKRLDVKTELSNRDSSQR